jgi:hypothetical protein
MSTSWRATRPGSDEYLEYYGRYIAKVPDGDIIETLSSQITGTGKFLRSIPESKGDHRYGPDKWSIREVIGHVSDCERVFAYRAMRFARADETPLPGFDENAYVANATFGTRSIDELVSEFEHIRHGSIHLLRGLDEAAWSRRGIANGAGISVRALAFILAGHELHHLELIRTRYL